MPSKIKFKQSTLTHSMHLILKMQGIPKLICSSLLLSVCVTPSFAQTSVAASSSTASPTVSDTSAEQLASVDQQNTAPITDIATLVTQAQQQQDSLAILQQQEQFPNQINEFKPS